MIFIYEIVSDDKMEKQLERKTKIDRDSCASFKKQCINARNKMVEACSKQQRLAAVAPTYRTHTDTLQLRPFIPIES